jgi:hypothetical protein
VLSVFSCRTCCLVLSRAVWNGYTKGYTKRFAPAKYPYFA